MPSFAHQEPRKARPDAGNACLPAKEGGSWLQTKAHNMNLKNAVLGLAVVAFVGFVSSSFADDTKVAGKKSLESRIAELEAKLKDAGVGGGVKGSGIKVSGYVDTSYLVNLADRNSNGPIAGSSSQNTGRVFDNQFNAFNLNAVKLTLEKSKDSSKFPAGFRVDTIVGEDAETLRGNKFGSNGVLGSDSTLFIEQAYVNLGIPVGNGIDVKFGKMVSLVGYEAIESPANWQFSRSDAFRLAPATQTGATFGYKWNDTVTTTVGIINGLDALVGNAGAVNYNTDLAFVGRVDVTGPKTSFGDFNAFVAGLYGNDNPLGVFGPTAATQSNNQNAYLLDIGGTWAKPFGVKDLSLGIDALYRYQELSYAGVGGILSQNASVDAGVLSAYGKWDWASLGAKWTSTSGRFSYSAYNNQTSTGLATVGLTPLVAPTTGFVPRHNDVYSFTLTQAFNVWKDTLVRLEWRHDWTDSKAAGFGTADVSGGPAQRDDIRQDQDTIAVNVVYSF